MTEEPKPDERLVKVKVKTLRCRRTGQMFTVAQHVECPYCSAHEATIEGGSAYDAFCEFRQGKDPVSFGFPPDSTRTQHG